jgi:hypothetical protein
MTKEEALAFDLALEALKHLQPTALTSFYTIGARDKAITAIKQARSAPVQSCYCPNCEAMGKELAALKAQPAPVQPVAQWRNAALSAHPNSDPEYWPDSLKVRFMEQEIAQLRATPPNVATPLAAQRQWVGLTDKEFENIIMSAPNATVPVLLWQLIQDKLKEKNT